MHRNGIGLDREKIVQQVKDGDPSIHDYRYYIPVGKAADKLHLWKKQGAEIFYLTSRREDGEIRDIQAVLQRYDFPDGQLVFRRKGEEYKAVAERIMPEVLIEDDCESIGGMDHMTITFVDRSLKKKIISVPVREFGGIDHLAGNIDILVSAAEK